MAKVFKRIVDSPSPWISTEGVTSNSHDYELCYTLTWKLTEILCETNII